MRAFLGSNVDGRAARSSTVVADLADDAGKLVEGSGSRAVSESILGSPEVTPGPAGASFGERRDTSVTDLVRAQKELLALRQRPTGTRRGECSEAGVADLVAA